MSRVRQKTCAQWSRTIFSQCWTIFWKCCPLLHVTRAWNWRWPDVVAGFKICFCFLLLYNKSNDWSLGKQWILFLSNLNISLNFVSGNKIHCSPRDQLSQALYILKRNKVSFNLCFAECDKISRRLVNKSGFRELTTCKIVLLTMAQFFGTAYPVTLESASLNQFKRLLYHTF